MFFSTRVRFDTMIFDTTLKCDASFSDGECTVACVLVFSHYNNFSKLRIVHQKIINVPNATVAEFLAIFLCLNFCLKLGLIEILTCSDCLGIINGVKGYGIHFEKGNLKEKDIGLLKHFENLKSVTGKDFKKIILRWDRRVYNRVAHMLAYYARVCPDCITDDLIRDFSIHEKQYANSPRIVWFPNYKIVNEVKLRSKFTYVRAANCAKEESPLYLLQLTQSKEECLQRLHNRLDVAYDSSIYEHEEALRALWKCAFPEEELHGLVSEQWKEMGWQGKDPSTDFRGGSFISLENLLFFARNFPKSFQDLLRKQEGDRAMREYPFAVAGVNITFMLIQMLDLEAAKPQTLVGATFLKFLSENESAFDLLYSITFKLMDHQFLAMHASYRDFNTVMKATRRRLERELLHGDVTQLEDLPSYSLLTR